MQPPPRKVKPAAALKNTYADQVSKLQAKHQQECDLLEDIRTFFLRKAVLEKEYAQGLQKITSQLLKREFPAQPDLTSDDGHEHKTVCTVWRSVLEEADRMAKARLQAAEVYAEKVAEPLKPAKSGKIQCVKKVMPQLSTIQAESMQCVMDMVKSNKTYATENGIAHDARQKSLEAEDKLKRKSTGIFQSLAGLQKNAAKLRGRTETSEGKETAARNDYVLNLAAANAHHIRYYSTDLPDIMKTMDCDIYEKIQESLTVAGQTAAEIAETETTSFQSIAVEAAKICRQFSLQCYLFQNPVFTNLVQYQFEPSHEDSCNKVSSDHGAGPELEKEARKWATKTAKETRAIRDYYRQLTVLQNSKTADKTSDSGSQEAANTDPEVKMEEVKQNIRKAETNKLKAEARLESLRTGGVNVDEWISQAQMESLVAEESGLARTPSQLSLRTESSGGHSMDDQEPTYTNYDDDDDFIDDTFHTTGVSRSGRVYPIYCKALYDFEASNYDEMSIKASEDLELIADGDGEGWIKAKNSLGQEGYIPETYVEQALSNDATTPVAVETNNAINDNFTAAAALSSSSSNPVTTAPVTTTSPQDIQSPTSVDFQQDTTSSYSSGDLEVQQTTEVMTSDAQVPMVDTAATVSSDIVWAKALYDYEGQTDEELSFQEGTLIKVLRKDDNGVDDGFWEGECNGSVGVFPSLVVEEIGAVVTPNDPTSPGSYVDYSIPPPVHVTLPTPDGEPPPPPPLVNGEECDEPLPPPPSVFELEDVDKYQSAQDSQPMAPPPPLDMDQIQQKRVRFNTEEQQPIPALHHPKDNTQPTHHSSTVVRGDINPHCQKGNILKPLQSLKMPKSLPQSVKNPNTTLVPEYSAKNVNEYLPAKINNTEVTHTSLNSLSRHKSLPNCNTTDGAHPVKRSPIPIRSKSMMLSQQQQKQTHKSHIPVTLSPPPSQKKQHNQRQNYSLQHPNQRNTQKPPQQIPKPKGGSVALLPSSHNFVDKFLSSPTSEKSNTPLCSPPSTPSKSKTNLPSIGSPLGSPNTNPQFNPRLDSPGTPQHTDSPLKCSTQQMTLPPVTTGIPQPHHQQHSPSKLPSRSPLIQQPLSPTLQHHYHHHHQHLPNSNGTLRHLPETNNLHLHQDHSTSHQQQHFFSSKGQTYNMSPNRRPDKLPLCFNMDEEWESEEGEESLV